MKTRIFIFILISSVIFYLHGCSDSTVNPPPPPPTLNGIFILNEGTFGDPQSYDYSFINTSNDSVYSRVFRSANNFSLNSFPDGMVLYRDNNLYVTAQGNYLSQGTIYKINSSNNQLISSRNFGKNPYNLIIVNDKIYVSNISGSYVSVMDINLNPIADSVATGPNPNDMVYSIGNVYVAKASYTTEYSVAIINTVNNSVSKVFLPAPPVSLVESIGGIYVSSYTRKKLYLIDSSSLLKDSIQINIPSPAMGEMVAGSPGVIYIADYDTATYSSKRVYKFNVSSGQIDPNFNIQFTGTDDVYGITYDKMNGRLYITNSKGGVQNGELRIYDSNGNLIKTYPDIGGKFPKRVAFKYQ
ncbi:MAG: hypothetical protein N2510_00075 [Ignavibacteria bacterium]|nr:hypothetical protein [Ignavibacteria bacterium]